MNSRYLALLAAVALSPGVFARPALEPGCGTHFLTSREELYLHGRWERSHGMGRVKRSIAARTTNTDAGNIAIIDDSGGVVARRNPFDLNQKTLAFAPAAASAARYTLINSGNSYDAQAASSGKPLSGLGDDDSRPVNLPFAFPFFGASYRVLFINSDGNLTFTAGDPNTADRSLGRMVAGAPRISPMFTDLDPTAARQGGVRVLAESARFVVTWDAVPVYSDFGYGTPQTFQVRLYPSGRIEFAYSGANPLDAITGIAPGENLGETTLLSLSNGSSREFSGAVADRFAGADAIDTAILAEKFYATHDDAYDYLVIYNALGIPAATGAVAYEVTARNSRDGYGDQMVEDGAEYGSPARLQSVLNMGPLEQYPLDPNAPVPLRVPSGDTPLTVLGHEAGHLFLAFASVRDPDNPEARPMLGRANVHWAFNFNSEASLLEGNRIQDNGDAASPRFITTKTVEGYSPLDQYLMGFRAAGEVAPMFLVNGATVSAARAPQSGVSFDGKRREITVDDLLAVYGRRIPDYTVSQRHFRFGFIILTAAGAAPPADAIAQVDAYRTQFESFYARATSNRATADTALKRAVHVSAFPALAVPQARAGTVTITLDHPASTPLTVFLSGQSGIAGIPASVTIAAGGAKTTFLIQGLRAGTEELTFRPADASYETVYAQVAVAPATSSLSLALASGNSIFRVSDSNRLPVTGVRVTAAITGKGSLTSPSVITDENGLAAFNWTPGASDNQITAMIEGAPGSAITVKLARPVIFGVTNAASYVPGITPGAYASIFGADLATTVQVLVNGELAQTTYISDGQINLLIPADILGTPATVAAVTPAASSIEYRVASYLVSPGIFAVVNRGSALEIYATGLNGASPQVSIGGVAASVVYIGQPQFPGLDQVNVMVPGGLSAGRQRVVITAGGVASNSADVQLP